MKTLGLIGGLSWYSTVVYYKTINELVNKKLGDSHSAKILLYSVDFNDFKLLQEKNDWVEIERMIIEIALKLQRAGAECIIMCTNTPHLIADKIRQCISVPLIHIAEETAKSISCAHLNTVGLIGTRFTMESDFFINKLNDAKIKSLIPKEVDRQFIHDSIFNELTKGIFKKETKDKFLAIFTQLQKEGAQGIILGCTEIALLINQDDCSLPLFDTAKIHSYAAVDFALSDIGS